MDNKKRLAKWIKDNLGAVVSPDSIFDIMVKRIHEYKRQLMNIIYIIYRYFEIKNTPKEERAAKFVPRVSMLGGKSAPGYVAAKAIIKLINSVSDKINNDEDIGDLLKVFFLPNYNVSNAQIIIPGSELSQHISTAGMEASGTSNMKFVMNGCLIIGTMDGANVEIAEEIGAENMFICGAKVNEVNDLRKKQSESRDHIDPLLARVLHSIKSGFFGDLSCCDGIIDSLENGRDHYIVCQDFYSYKEAHDRVDVAYRDKKKWAEMAITGIAHSGKFSSDRTISEYCKDIWKIEPISIPKPASNPNQRVRSFANIQEINE